MKTVGSKLNFLFVEPLTRVSTLVPRQHYFLVSKTADFLKYPQTLVMKAETSIFFYHKNNGAAVCVGS